MTKLIFTKGRRLYTAASIMTIVVAGLHTFGFSQPDPPEYDGVLAAMRGSIVPMGMGMNPSVFDVYRSLAFGVSILVAGLGVMGLVLASTTDASRKVLSRSAAMFAVTCAGLSALGWITRVPPPFLSFAVLTLFWSLSMRTTRFV